MILKYGDHDHGWTWVGNIRSAREIKELPGAGDWDVSVGTNENPVYIELTFKNGERFIYRLGVNKVYLCNEDSGSTIDVIKN